MPLAQTEHEIAERESALFTARKLLLEILPEKAAQELLETGSFRHEGKFGVYRIRQHEQTEIYKNGRLSAFACLQLTILAPSYDRMIAEYLILAGAEDLYWNRANVFPVKRGFDLTTIVLSGLNIALLARLILDYFPWRSLFH